MTIPPDPTPLAYAAPNTAPRGTTAAKVIAVLSVGVGLATVAGCGYLTGAVLLAMSVRPRGASGDGTDVALAALLGLSTVLGLLLLGAAYRVLSDRPGGVRLHRMYAVAQILAALAFGGVLVANLTGPIGGLAVLGLVPGLIGCVWPGIVLVVMVAEPVGAPATARLSTDRIILGRCGLAMGVLGLLVGVGLLLWGVSSLADHSDEVRRAAYAAVDLQHMAAQQAAARAAFKAAATQLAASPPRALTGAEADAVVAEVRQQCAAHPPAVPRSLSNPRHLRPGTAMPSSLPTTLPTVTPAQVAALTAALRSPGQSLIDGDLPLASVANPSNGYAAQSVQANLIWPGDLAVSTRHLHGKTDPGTFTRLELNPSGGLIVQVATSAAGTVTTTPQGTSRMPPRLPPSNLLSAGNYNLQTARIRRDWRLGLTLVIASPLNLLTAVATLVGSARLLGRGNGRLLYRLAWMKLPAALMTAAALDWAFNGDTWLANPMRAAVVLPVMLGLAGAVVPVLAIVVLHGDPDGSREGHA